MAKEKTIKELEDLPGVGPTTADKLRSLGFDTIEKIATAAPHELAEISGMKVDAAKQAVDAAKQATTLEYKTGSEINDKRKSLGKITTGSKNLDDLLGGGVEANAITEAYGKFASGKTQLGFQLTVNAQKPVEQGGLGGTVMLIDTEGTFRPDRIEQIAKAAGMDPKAALDNIFVVRATTAVSPLFRQWLSLSLLPLQAC